MCSLSSKNLYSLCMLHVLDVVVLKDRQQRLLPASIPMPPYSELNIDDIRLSIFV